MSFFNQFILQHEQKDSPSNDLEQAIDGTIKSVYELRTQLQETALQQVNKIKIIQLKYYVIIFLNCIINNFLI